MDMNNNTDYLRNLAPKWSLAGDEKLLELLQSTHQNIVSKSQNVNQMLSEMSAGLNDANISLQNVNNRFMSLSNSQFIESRVYEDESDTAPEAAEIKDPPKPSVIPPDIAKLKHSLSILERLHDPVTILSDSDTDSDSDDERIPTVVLKPKDVYSCRPLPHVIGSQPWQDKWHAGLIVEDSDSDSDSSAREGARSPEYSASDSGGADQLPDRPCDEVPELPAAPDPPPAEVAAGLARRLAGTAPHGPQIPEPEPDYVPPPGPIVKTVYKPEVPQVGATFRDSPPPLDSPPRLDSPPPPDSDSSHEDIFAELHRGGPGGRRPRAAADDLFDFTDPGAGPVPSHSGPGARRVGTPDTTPVSPGERSARPEGGAPAAAGTRKPIGGVPVFGVDVGAAAPGRDPRGAPPPGAGPGDRPGNENVDQTDASRTQTEIFDDLFSKKKDKVKQEKVVPKVDLFADSLFEDTDDIFTSGVHTEHKEKSIFEDDDELFAEVAAPAPRGAAPGSRGGGGAAAGGGGAVAGGGLFDSDDELFGDGATDPATSGAAGAGAGAGRAGASTNTLKGTTKSIFDSDSDSDIFASVHAAAPAPHAPAMRPADSALIVNNGTNSYRSPSLFDDDDCDDTAQTLHTNDVTSAPNTLDKPDAALCTSSSEVETTAKPNAAPETVAAESSIMTNGAHSTLGTSNIVSQNNSKSKEVKHFNADTTTVLDPRPPADAQSPGGGLTRRVANGTLCATTERSDHDDGLTLPGAPPRADSTVDDNIPNEPPAAVGGAAGEAAVAAALNGAFANILTEPPAFEKKEFKNSNVNALFEDDSEDEGFFRRSDVPDEAPRDLAPGDLFLFMDEPPELDAGARGGAAPPTGAGGRGAASGTDANLTPTEVNEEYESERTSGGAVNIDEIDELFKASHSRSNLSTSNYLDIDIDADIFGPKVGTSAGSIASKNTTSKILDPDIIKEDPDISQKPSTLQSADVTTDDAREQGPFATSGRADTESKDVNEKDNKKSVNKVRSMNLPIDVAALLPGASPKKTIEVKPHGPSEGARRSPAGDDPELVKSVSFGGEPNAEVLDSTLSKQRARIQVKRRPSSRRARREAVRTSTIDINNSECSPDPAPSAAPHRAPRPQDAAVEADQPDVTHDYKSDLVKDQKITKVVYVLNDEDIFETENKRSNESDDDLFRGSARAAGSGGASRPPNTPPAPPAPPGETRAAWFDSDEELFGDTATDRGFGKTKPHRVDVMTSLFDGEDDDELFGGAPRDPAPRSEHSGEYKPVIIKSSKETSRSTQPAYEDPLSLLGDDD
ncbi:WASH complex subunit 2 [Bombyx mandarina]|uniref:WASH complex subunit 2 n=1 Tax=Bombyx mandarina TaxID=7092 RepID=A0A6J2JWM5_BOMMA|nr:WASH complex subunit 2 [Bombyx mandarina]